MGGNAKWGILVIGVGGKEAGRGERSFAKVSN